MGIIPWETLCICICFALHFDACDIGILLDVYRPSSLLCKMCKYHIRREMFHFFPSSHRSRRRFHSSNTEHETSRLVQPRRAPGPQRFVHRILQGRLEAPAKSPCSPTTQSLNASSSRAHVFSASSFPSTFQQRSSRLRTKAERTNRDRREPNGLPSRLRSSGGLARFLGDLGDLGDSWEMLRLLPVRAM